MTRITTSPVLWSLCLGSKLGQPGAWDGGASLDNPQPLGGDVAAFGKSSVPGAELYSLSLGYLEG